MNPSPMMPVDEIDELFVEMFSADDENDYFPSLANEFAVEYHEEDFVIDGLTVVNDEIEFPHQPPVRVFEPNNEVQTLAVVNQLPVAALEAWIVEVCHSYRAGRRELTSHDAGRLCRLLQLNNRSKQSVEIMLFSAVIREDIVNNPLLVQVAFRCVSGGMLSGLLPEYVQHMGLHPDEHDRLVIAIAACYAHIARYGGKWMRRCVDVMLALDGSQRIFSPGSEAATQRLFREGIFHTMAGKGSTMFAEMHEWLQSFATGFGENFSWF